MDGDKPNTKGKCRIKNFLNGINITISASAFDPENCVIGINGLGNVGLPLAVAFSKIKESKLEQIQQRKVIGFDLNKERVKDLKNNIDKTGEISSRELIESKNLITCEEHKLFEADILIITVLSINISKQPDLNPLKKHVKPLGKYF